jgi:hypothetical protein
MLKPVGENQLLGSGRNNLRGKGNGKKKPTPHVVKGIRPTGHSEWRAK